MSICDVGLDRKGSIGLLFDGAGGSRGSWPKYLKGQSEKYRGSLAVTRGGQTGGNSRGLLNGGIE